MTSVKFVFAVTAATNCASVHVLSFPRIAIPRRGFEPRFTAPKAVVLPLDERGVGEKLLAQFHRSNAPGRLRLDHHTVGRARQRAVSWALGKHAEHRRAGAAQQRELGVEL